MEERGVHERGVAEADNATEETKTWILRNFEEGKKIYMVVGIKTVTVAKVTVSRYRNAQTSIEAALSGSTAEEGIAVTLARATSCMKEEYDVNEGIVAVEYCEVQTRRWLKKGPRVKLDQRGGAWRWYAGAELPRGVGTDKEYDSIVLEVSAGQTVDADVVEKIEEEEPSDGELRRILFGDVELVCWLPQAVAE